MIAKRVCTPTRLRARHNHSITPHQLLLLHSPGSCPAGSASEVHGLAFHGVLAAVEFTTLLLPSSGLEIGLPPCGLASPVLGLDATVIARLFTV